MRILFIYLLISISEFASAQTQSYFLDYWDKRCEADKAYYSRIAVKKDSVWDVKDYYVNEGRFQMQGYYLDDSLSVKEGLFTFYHKNGKVSLRSEYRNNKLDGLNLGYDSLGRLNDSTLYKGGIPIFAYCWNPNGNLIFKSMYDTNGEGIGEQWYYHDNGVLSDYGKCREGIKKDGIWNCYRIDGSLSCKEYYKDGKLKKRECFDTNRNVQKKNCKDEPVEIEAGERRKMKKLLKEVVQRIDDSTKRTVGKPKGRFIIDICIDVDGKATYSIVQSLHPVFDSLFLELMSNVKFTPARISNRPQKVCDVFKYDMN